MQVKEYIANPEAFAVAAAPAAAEAAAEAAPAAEEKKEEEEEEDDDMVSGVEILAFSPAKYSHRASVFSTKLWAPLYLPISDCSCRSTMYYMHEQHVSLCPTSVSP